MEMVRVLDLKTKKIVNIPAAELAPGMVPAKVQGIDGTVWIDSTQLQNRDRCRHPPLSAGTRDHLRLIKAILEEVRPMSLEAWENGFRQDQHPDREIALWLRIAAVYEQVTTEAAWTLEQKREILKVLVMCSMSGKDHVLATVEPKLLSREDAAEIANRYHQAE